MFSSAVLFSVLVTIVGLVSASPLPMPAVKQSGRLAARSARHGLGPIWDDGTWCWKGDRYGRLRDRNCDLIDLDLKLDLLEQHNGLPFANGDPCWYDNRFGSIFGTSCSVLDIEIKRDFAPFPYGQPVYLDNTPCWRSGRFGYLKDRSCGLIDIDVGLNLLGLGNNRWKQPYFVDGTPCWSDNRFGYIQSSSCAVIDIDVTNVNVLKRGGYYLDSAGRPRFEDNSPCYENGQFGYFKDALCIVADLDVGIVKKDLLAPIFDDGTACWRGGRVGRLYNRQCSLLDTGIQIGLFDGSWYPGFYQDGPCWREDRFGRIHGSECLVDLDLDVVLSKRLLNDESLVGELLGGPDYRFSNAHPGNVPPPKPLLGLAGLKRNGLLHHAPSGNTVDSALKSVNQVLDHSVTKRDLLDGGLLRPGYEYYDDDDIIADLTGADGLGHGNALGLKRGLGPLDGLTGGKKSGNKQGNQGGLGGLDSVTGILG